MIDFSLIIPTYNHYGSLMLAVEDLNKIDYENYEVIIVNDGSTDNTTSYLKEIKNPKVRIINTKNGGVSRARNVGILAAKGEYIVFADDDDSVSPDIFKRLRRAITENNKPDFVRFSGVRKDCNGKIIGNIPGFSRKTSVMEQITRVKDKIDCYVVLLAIKNKGIKLFRENIKYLEDEIFYIDNFLDYNKRIVTIPDQLYCYNYNPNSKTKKAANIMRNIDDLIEAGITIQHITGLTDRQRLNEKANISNMVYWRYRDSIEKLGKRKSELVALKGYELLRRNGLKPSLFSGLRSFGKYLVLAWVGKMKRKE